MSEFRSLSFPSSIKLTNVRGYAEWQKQSLSLINRVHLIYMFTGVSVAMIEEISHNSSKK